MPIRLPTEPVRLITALPSERSSGGVRSGMSATTGARQSDITKTKRIIITIVAATLFVLSATMGMRANRTAEIGAPVTMNGRRLPSFEWQRSESFPKVGWKITPKILSNVMMIPMNSGTRVMLAPKPTSSPCALARFASHGSASLSFALRFVTKSDEESSRLRIFVT